MSAAFKNVCLRQNASCLDGENQGGISSFQLGSLHINIFPVEIGLVSSLEANLGSFCYCLLF